MKGKHTLRGPIGDGSRGTRILIALTGLLGLALSLSLTGCGGPGSDGKGYIAYTWLYGPIDFDTDDPAFDGQTYIYNGDLRESRPGVWSFEYVAWDDSYWYGNYEIYISKGESGGLLSDGADGADLYFEFAAYSIGPFFFVWESPNYVASGVSGLVAATGAGVSVSGVDEVRQTEMDAAAATDHPTERGDQASKMASSGERPELSASATTQVIEHDRFTLVLRYEKEKKE